MWVPKVWLLGLISTWAHNLFVLWAFGFPIMGDPMLGSLNTLQFTQTLLSTSQSFFQSDYSFLSSFSPAWGVQYNLISILGPKLGLEVSGLRLKVQVWGRSYDVLWGLGPRNTGSRAQASYQGPNSHTIAPPWFVPGYRERIKDNQAMVVVSRES